MMCVSKSKVTTQANQVSIRFCYLKPEIFGQMPCGDIADIREFSQHCNWIEHDPTSQFIKSLVLNPLCNSNYCI